MNSCIKKKLFASKRNNEKFNTAKYYELKMKKISLDGLLQSIEVDTSVRRLIQSSPVCHKIFDPDLKLRFMSHSGVAALQIENVEDFYGHTFPPDFAPKITRDIFDKHIVLAAKGETSTIEYSFKKDGDDIWFRTTLSPFLDTDGSLIYITADSMDITDRKKADMLLREAHDRLEVWVEERTKKLRETNAKLNVEIHERKLTEESLKLNEEKLKKYASELERSNNELESFTSIASHDLQEPLRKIITFGDRLILRIPEIDEKGRDYLDRIQKSAMRMRNFVEDLLQYTRIESKIRPLESLSIHNVVKNVLDDLDSRIEDSQGVVNIKGLPVIHGDPVQMHQLFLNLIGNALKFHREGIPPVVNLDTSKMENGFWKISVEDNGIGIEEQYVDRIFKPFERLHGRSTYEGTGMGLTICKKIVSRHGGKITVKRKSTNGVTFHVTFPAKQNTGDMI